MVANLTRYSACKVDPDVPNRPVRINRDGTEAATKGHRAPMEQKAPLGDEPVRLFAWVSA